MNTMYSLASHICLPLAAITCAGLLCLGVPALARTLRVLQDYPTVKEALGQVSNGDTILVAPGIHDVQYLFSGSCDRGA